MRYFQPPAQVQCGPPYRRPALYTTITGEVPPVSPQVVVVHLSQHGFKPQSGDDLRGGLVSQANPITLNPPVASELMF